MRPVLLSSVLAVMPVVASAQELKPEAEMPIPPPAYKNVLRFDEDYSCLTNPANRTDFFDPIKYIPLRRDAPDWYLTLGGEVRERFEGVYDPGFGIGGQNP